MRPIKKPLLVALSLMCALSTVSTVRTTASIIVDDKAVTMTQQPCVEKGTTMVPIRTIGESFGCSVNYDKKSQKVVLSNATTTIILTIGDLHATVNGNTKLLTVAPFAKSGTVMVPLRFIGEAFSCTVNLTKNGDIIIDTSSAAILNNGVNQSYQTREVQTSLNNTDIYGNKIRTTNLPKNANMFAYIQDEIPNEVYEKCFNYVYNTPFYSNEKNLEVDTSICCTGGTAQSLASKTSDPINTILNATALINDEPQGTVKDHIDRWISCSIAPSYKTKTDEQLNYYARVLTFMMYTDPNADATKTSELRQYYFQLYYKYLNEYRLLGFGIEDGEYFIMPEAAYYPFVNNSTYIAIPVYVKGTVTTQEASTANGATTKNLNHGVATYTMTWGETGKTNSSLNTVTDGDHINGVMWILFKYDSTHKGWEVFHRFSDWFDQLNPSVNILGGCLYPKTGEGTVVQDDLYITYHWMKAGNGYNWKRHEYKTNVYPPTENDLESFPGY